MSIVDQVFYLLTAFLALAMAILVFVQRPKEPSVRAFAAFLISTAGWVTSLQLYYLLVDSASVILVGRLNYVFAELAVFFLLLFAYNFPSRTVKAPRWLKWLIIISFAATTVSALTTDLIAESGVIRGIARQTNIGTAFPWFAAYIVFLVVAGLALLYRKSQTATGEDLKHLRLFIYAWLVGTLGIIVIFMVTPMMAGKQEWLRYGPYTALVSMLIYGYAVAKQQMLKIRVLGTELFVATLVLLFAINLATAVSDVSRMIAGVSLSIGLIFGFLLIRNAESETEKHAQINDLMTQLNLSNQQLREMSEAKSEFISIASHQLRTPVSVIKGYLALILEGHYGEIGVRVKEKLQQLVDANERLVLLISNLLNVSRIERGSVDFDCRETDIIDLIRKAVATMLIKVQGKDVKLLFKESREHIDKVYIDAIKVTEVIANLVDNAIKYTPVGSIEVSVADDKKEDRVIVRIKDTGIGMEKEDAPHIFEKFFRPIKPSAPWQAGNSMGIGLYICAKFLRSMGGNIFVESTAPGRGTTMAVILPKRATAVCIAEEIAKPAAK